MNTAKNCIRGAVAALLVLVAACSDKGTSPSIAARLESVSGDAQPGTVGSPLSQPLIVRALDANDAPAPGVSVSWNVTGGGGTVNPSQTTTDNNGLSQTTWTLGQTVGLQSASANIAGVGNVNFSANASGLAPTCSGSPLELAVGGSLLLVGNQATETCLGGGATQREYTLVAFNTSRNPNSNFTINLTGTGVVTVTGPPTPDAPNQLLAPVLEQRSKPNRDWHLDLRRRERAELTSRVQRGGIRRNELLVPPAQPLLSLANPVIGEQFQFNVNAAQGCTLPDMHTGRVAAISQHAIVVHDLANPAGGFSNAEYASLAATFDTLVYPLNVENFNVPADIDNNSKIVIFYTRAVNELTAPGSPNGYVAGYFYGRDLFLKAGGGGMQACAGSNESEMFYMIVPDQNGEINGNQRTKQFVFDISISALAHEFQHLINSSRRLWINTSASFPEEIWMEEGLAHIAEELTFFRASGHATGVNLTAQTLLGTSRSINAFNDFEVENLFRLRDHMQSPTGSAAFEEDVDLATRGAIYYFLRYLADRRGGTHSATWRALTDGPQIGFNNLENKIAADPMQWMRDWAVALYTDDAVSGVAPQFTVPSWNLRSVFAGLSPPIAYPINPLHLTNASQRTATLFGGGTQYFRVGVAGGQGRVVIAPSSGTSLSNNLSVTVVRTK